MMEGSNWLSGGAGGDFRPVERRGAVWGRLCDLRAWRCRSEEHTSELQSLMRISYAVFCLKKKTKRKPIYTDTKIKQKKRTTTATEHKSQTTTTHKKKHNKSHQSHTTQIMTT